MRRAPTSLRGGRSRVSARCAPRAGCAVCGSRDRSPSAAASRSRSTSTSSPSRGRARICSVRCSIAISRATCRSIRSPKPCCGPTRAGRSADGECSRAPGRRSDVLRGARRCAVPLRLLPDAAPARVPLRREAALGPRAAADRRAGASRPGSGSGVRAVTAGVVHQREQSRAAAAGAVVRPVRPERTAAHPPHRVRVRAADAWRRSHLQPVRRHLSPPLPGAVLPRLGAGAAGGEPRSAARRSVHRLRRHVHRHRTGGVSRPRRDPRPGEALSRRRADPTGAKCGGADAGARALLSRAGARRGVRRPLAAAGCARADVPDRGARAARRRRRARRPGLGPSEQVQDSPGTVGPEAIRKLSARRRAAQKTRRLGADVPVWRARLGRAAAAETGRGAAAVAWRRHAPRLDRLAGPTPPERRRRRFAPRSETNVVNRSTRRMSEISRSSLFGKLNSLAYKAIEGATVFCKLRGNPYVELVHWLQQILQTQDSDLHRIVRHFELDPSRLAKDVTDALDRLPRGATSISDLSSHVENAVERGWVYATLIFGEPRVRTGHLAIGILKTPSLRNALMAISKQFEKIKPDTLTDDFAKIVNGSPEDRLCASDGTSLPRAGGGGGAGGAAP